LLKRVEGMLRPWGLLRPLRGEAQVPRRFRTATGSGKSEPRSKEEARGDFGGA